MLRHRSLTIAVPSRLRHFTPFLDGSAVRQLRDSRSVSTSVLVKRNFSSIKRINNSISRSVSTTGMASNSNSPPPPANDLKLGLVEAFLNLEKLDKHLYRSTHLMPGLPTSQRVYGGQVIGQSLVAAGKTVPADYHVHSLHCYFIKAGDKNMPIVYHIDPVRDGRSFATRFVKAVQDGEAIFSCQLSFHKEEPTSLEHQMPMPVVPKPNELKDAYVILQEACARTDLSDDRRRFMRERLRQLPATFDLRPTDPEAFLRVKTVKPHYFLWVKSKGPVGDEIRLHHCVAAFISDSSMVGTALLPHLAAGFRLGMAVSLDHSMWFHRYDFKIDNWMLYETESTIAVGGRAFIHGRLWTTDGVLVLSTAQEALIRAKMPDVPRSVVTPDPTKAV